jgi:hypothetical protein
MALTKLSSTQARKLRDVLLLCRYMKGSDSRGQLIADLQKDYPEISFRSSQDPRIEVAGIVDSCFDFGGAPCLEAFLKILGGYEGEDGDRMKAVWAVWEETISPPVPKQLRQDKPGEGQLPGPAVGTVRPRDDVSWVGRELHWDREHVVEKFVDVARGIPGEESIRVLAIPARPEADPGRLMERLEAICEELSRTPGSKPQIIHARIELKPNWQEFQIVTEVLSVLASKAGDCATQLDEVREQIEREWQGRRTPRPSTALLAKNFSECLAELAEKCRIVILLHRFQNITDDVRSWLKTAWLTRHIPNLQGVVVVLAGAPGLDGFSRPPHMVCFDPLPLMSARDLWEWAYEGHHLTWLTLELVTEYNRKRIHGSPLRFYEAIEAFKLLAQFAPEEKLHELLSQQLKS